MAAGEDAMIEFTKRPHPSHKMGESYQTLGVVEGTSTSRYLTVRACSNCLADQACYVSADGPEEVISDDLLLPCPQWEPVKLYMTLSCTDATDGPDGRIVWELSPGQRRGALYWTTSKKDCIDYPNTKHVPALTGVLDPEEAWRIILASYGEEK